MAIALASPIVIAYCVMTLCMWNTLSGTYADTGIPDTTLTIFIIAALLEVLYGLIYCVVVTLRHTSAKSVARATVLVKAVQTANILIVLGILILWFIMAVFTLLMPGVADMGYLILVCSGGMIISSAVTAIALPIAIKREGMFNKAFTIFSVIALVIPLVDIIFAVATLMCMRTSNKKSGSAQNMNMGQPGYTDWNNQGFTAEQNMNMNQNNYGGNGQ